MVTGDETRQDPSDAHPQEGGDDSQAPEGQDAAADPGISKEQDERYVIEHAKLLVHSTGIKETAQAMKDLRTAVAFLEAHGD